MYVCVCTDIVQASVILSIKRKGKRIKLIKLLRYRDFKTRIFLFLYHADLLSTHSANNFFSKTIFQFHNYCTLLFRCVRSNNYISGLYILLYQTNKAQTIFLL